MAVAGVKGRILHSMDFTAAYLNGKLDEEPWVVIEPPPEAEIPKTHVCRLRMALYGLKIAGKVWRERLDKFIRENSWKRSYADPCLYYKEEPNGERDYAMIHVDDVLTLTRGEDGWKNLLKLLQSEFTVKDCGEADKFLGLQVEQSSEGVFIHQTRFTHRLLEKYGYKVGGQKQARTPCYRPSKTLGKSKYGGKDEKIKPRALAGEVLWLTRNTRPTLAYSVSRFCQITHEPTEETYERGHKILRYLASSTKKVGILFRRGLSTPMEAYADSDWAGNYKEHTRSQSGGILMWGGGPLLWLSFLQKSTAESSAAAELAAAKSTIVKVMWVRSLSEEMKLPLTTHEPTIIWEDNDAARLSMDKRMNGKKLRHLAVRMGFVTDQVEAGQVVIKRIGSDMNIADLFTKDLSNITLFLKFKAAITHER
jgi:hypothetical protein